MCPSLSSLRYRAVSTARLQDVVAFGNPKGKNWSVDYELRDIRSFFKSARVMVGLETSWDNLKSIKADILQISTEFSRRNTEYPLGSFVLSNGLMVEQAITIPFEKLAELEATPVIALSNHVGQGIGLTAEHALLLRLNGTPDIFFKRGQQTGKQQNFLVNISLRTFPTVLAPGDAYPSSTPQSYSHPRSEPPSLVGAIFPFWCRIEQIVMSACLRIGNFLTNMVHMKNYIIFLFAFTVVFISRLPFLDAGYGNEQDGWRVAAAARSIGMTGEYKVSRLPGFPVIEFACSLVWKYGDGR